MVGPIHAASRATALAAGFFGSILTWLFHYPSGAIAVFIGVAFGAVSALVAYALVYRVALRRLKNKKPVLGAIRGAALGIATFLIAVIGHTAFFQGRGGFFVSLVPIILIGLAMFGLGVAIVGACLGLFCERRYFR